MIRMTVLTSLDKPANKRFLIGDGGKIEVRSRGFPFQFDFAVHEFGNIRDMARRVPKIFNNRKSLAVLGAPVDEESRQDKTRKSYNFRDESVTWFCLDIDDLKGVAGKDEVLKSFPKALRETDCLFHWSSSAGVGNGQGEMLRDGFRGHFIFACEPTDIFVLKEMGRYIKGVDVSLFSKVQPHFFADPEFGEGVSCEIDEESRWSLIQGERLTVPRKEIENFVEEMKREEGEVDDGDGDDQDLLTLVSECKFIQSCAGSERLPEPEWYALLSLVDLAQAQELSMGDDRYDPVATQEKWEQAQDRSGPRTCKNLSDNFDKCRGCKYRGRIKTPGDILEMDRLSRDYVQVIGTEQFMEVERRIGYTRSQFDSLHSLQYENRGQTKASFVFEASPTGMKVDTVTYRPGGETFLVEDDDVSMSAINLWRPQDGVSVTDLEGRVIDEGMSDEGGGLNRKDCIWLDHVYRLCNKDDRVYEIVLDWFTFLVTHSGEKVNWALFLGGGQGIGKGLMMEPIQAILGWKNCYTITPDDLNGGWTHWLKGTKLVVVEEMASFGKREMANRLKPLITCPPHHLQINEKNQKQFRIPNLTAWVFMSNEPDALIVDKDDRRFFVVWSAMEPEGMDYYRDLGRWNADKDNLKKLFRFFQRREMELKGRFDPQGRAPMTEAKADMVSASRHSMAQYLADQVDEGLGAFSKDLVWANEVMDSLILESPFSRWQNLNTYTVGKAMKEAGFTKIEPRVKVVVDGVEKKRTIYVVRNFERYEGLQATQLRDILMGT